MIPRWFQSLCWIALAASGGLFVALGLHHVAYPGFLELMEADTLQQIARVAHGRPAYPLPDGEFIPLAYTPFYYYVAAPFYRLLGDGFAGPRLVSLLASLASGVLVFRFARRETGTAALGALAAAFFFAGFRIMDCWLTCALPDALFLFLLLSGFWFLAYGTRGLHELAWIVFFTLAFWTKQHGAFYFGFAVLYALFLRTNVWPRWTFVVAMLVGGPALYFGLAPWLGDGFVQQTLLVPGRWGRSARHAVQRTVFVLIEFVPYLCLLATVALPGAIRRRPLSISVPAWMVAASLLSTGATMMAVGASNNHYIPLIASLCVFGSLGVGRILRAENGRSTLTQVVVGCAALLLLTSAMTWLALRHGAHHPVPTFVPDVAAIALFVAVVLGVRSGLWKRTAPAKSAAHEPAHGLGNRGRRLLPAAALLIVAAQLACEYFPLAPQVARRTFSDDMAKLRRELDGLGGPVAWLPYGHVPTRLSGATTVTFPSTVALEDMARQEGAPGTTADRLAPFFQRIEELDGLHVLAADPIEYAVIWNELPVRWTLVRDYGDEFRGVQQITRHWFGGGSHPRYLYRMHCRTAAPVPHTADGSDGSSR